METLITGLPNIHLREKIRDDDFVDQLHHFVTVYLLVIAGIIVGIKEFAGTPLDCYFADNSWKHFQDHANMYCWTHDLYKYPNPANLSQVPFELIPGGPTDAALLTSKSPEELGEINFYRWITIIFVLQAFLFKLPNLIWYECNEYSGTQIEKMVSMIGEVNFEDRTKKNAVFSSVAEYMETWLIINRKPFWFMKSRVGRKSKELLQHCMLCVGTNTGNFLSTMYLVVKGLFLINVFAQFIILTSFLGFNYWEYGPRALQIYSDASERADNVHFPRVALCPFQVRGKGQWLQCLLTINMLLEKLFILEWFWLLLLLILTFVNFIKWVVKILRTNNSVKFVTRYLSIMNPDGSPPKEGHCTIVKFVTKYLGNDGVFLLRILATNTNDVAMFELASKVWQRYCEYDANQRVSIMRRPSEIQHNAEADNVELTFRGPKPASVNVEDSAAGDSDVAKTVL